MARFRKSPVVIEAERFLGGISYDEMVANWGKKFTSVAKYCNGELIINTLESHGAPLIASIGYWIIRGVSGEFYPCKPEIFQATYEPVDI